MANICSFWGSVNGNKSDVDDFVKYFTTDYNYNRDENGEYMDFPDHDHLQRVYYFHVDHSDGTEDNYCIDFSGECAWSLLTIFDSEGGSKSIKTTIQNSIQLEERRFVDFQTILDRLNTINGYIISEEVGFEFTELVEFGDGSYNMECEDYQEIPLWFEDFEDTFEEYIEGFDSIEKKMICDVLGIDELTEEKFKKAREECGADYISVSDADWLENEYDLFCSPKNYQTNE